MSIDNINAEISVVNIISVSSNSVTYDFAKQEHKKVKSTFTVKSLIKNTTCIRIKSTRKKYHYVVPTYANVLGDSSINIDCYFDTKIPMDDPKKHKFKIEAIIPDSTLQIQDPKEIFDYYEKTKTLVKGQIIKLNAVFINSVKGGANVDFGLETTTEVQEETKGMIKEGTPSLNTNSDKKSKGKNKDDRSSKVEESKSDEILVDDRLPTFNDLKVKQLESDYNNYLTTYQNLQKKNTELKDAYLEKEKQQRMENMKTIEVKSTEVPKVPMKEHLYYVLQLFLLLFVSIYFGKMLVR